MKINLEIDDLDGLLDDLQFGIQEASQAAAVKTYHQAKQKAMSKSRGSLWAENFSKTHESDGSVTLNLQGLGAFVEDTQPAGWLSHALEKGERFKHNKAEGKEYVDVPFEANKTQRKAINASEMAAQFTQKKVKITDRLKSGQKVVRPVDRLVARHSIGPDRTDTVVESKKSLTGDSEFLAIRRWTPGKIWPKHPTPGIRRFNQLDKEFEDNFYKELESILS